MPNFSSIIAPKTANIAVSHSHALGTYDYDMDELYSPDTNQWRSKVLHIGSPKYSPNKTYAFDRSRYNKHGTITGALWKQLPSGVWVLYFDNVDDKIVVPHNAVFNLVTGTLEAWVKTSKTSGNNEIIVKDTTGTGWDNPFLLRHEGGTILGRIGKNPTTLDIYSTTNISTLGIFYHATFTWDGSYSRMYINGVLEATSALYAFIPVVNNTDIQISKGPYGQFNGYIGEAKIYNRALSASEIMQNYLARKGKYGL